MLLQLGALLSGLFLRLFHSLAELAELIINRLQKLAYRLCTLFLEYLAVVCSQHPERFLQLREILPVLLLQHTFIFLPRSQAARQSSIFPAQPSHFFLILIQFVIIFLCHPLLLAAEAFSEFCPLRGIVHDQKYHRSNCHYGNYEK